MRVPVVLLAVLALAGCGTAEREGRVGDTLKAGSITATLQRFQPRVKPVRDVTGRGVPLDGMRFAAAHVSLCNKQGQAVIAYHFELLLAGGARVRPQQSGGLFGHEFDVVRNGCGRGVIVYMIPAGARAKALEYRYDDTGSGGQYGGDRAEHDRFDWTL